MSVVGLVCQHDDRRQDALGLGESVSLSFMLCSGLDVCVGASFVACRFLSTVDFFRHGNVRQLMTGNANRAADASVQLVGVLSIFRTSTVPLTQ